MVEANPVALGADATAEDIAANWERISDLSGHRHLGSAFDQTDRYVRAAIAAGEDA
jgi:hypothetical protein